MFSPIVVCDIEQLFNALPPYFTREREREREREFKFITDIKKLELDKSERVCLAKSPESCRVREFLKRYSLLGLP